MKSILHRVVSLALLLICLYCAASQVRPINSKSSAAPLKPADAATQAKVNEAYGKLPLSFEVNRGQADAPVRFLSMGGNYSILLGPNGVALNLKGAELGTKSESSDRSAQKARTHSVINVQFINANPSPQIEGMDELPGKSNYLIGSDPKTWRTDIPNYAKVRYREVWPGVDAVFYGNQQRLEYDFVIAPGANPRTVKLLFDGTKKIRMDAGGDLILRLGEGELRQRKPVVYQEVNGQKRMINGRYVVKGNQVGFEIGRYDRGRELVIDPVIEYSSRMHPGESIAVDPQGNAYITNIVEPEDAFFGRGGKEIRLLKLNPAGTQQLTNTIIGGNGDDIPRGIAVDAAGNAYITGETYSTEFPVNWGVPSIVSAGGCFKSADSGMSWSNSGKGLSGRSLRFETLIVDPANPAVIYARDLQFNDRLFKSTDRGASWSSFGVSISGVFSLELLAVTANPNLIYVATNKGLYRSADGGTAWNQTGLDKQGINSIAFDRSNPQILYATTLLVVYKSTDGGQNWSEANVGIPPNSVLIQELAIDPINPRTLYLIGLSQSAPTSQIYKSTDGAASWQRLVTNFSDAPTRSLAIDPVNPQTVYVGTDRGVFKSADGGNDWQSAGLDNLSVRFIAIDSTVPPVIYASTPYDSTGLPPGIQNQAGGVYKSVNGAVSWMAFDNLLKRTPVYALAIDPQNPATVYAGTDGNSDAFVIKVDATGIKLVYATIFGGGNDETGASIAIDAAGNAYITGSTLADPQPLFRNGFQSTTGSGFMAKLNPEGNSIVYSTLLPGPGNSIAVDSLGKAYVTGVTAGPVSVRNGFQTTPGSAAKPDAFVIRVDPDVTGEDSLLYSTYLGGSDRDEGRAMAIGSRGEVYVTGNTLSADFPTTAAARIGAKGDIFVTKLDTSKSGGASLVWSSAFGSGSANGIAVNSLGQAYLTGTTDQATFPVTPGALQTANAGGSCGIIYTPPGCNPRCIGFPQCCTGSIPIPCADAFVVKLNSPGTALIYSTYLGLSGSGEESKAIALDPAGNVYLTGVGKLTPTDGTFQYPLAKGFMTKLSLVNRFENLATVSAASFLPGPVAPESLAVGFLDAYGQGADRLGVTVRDSAGVELNATVLFSGSGQVNFHVPAGAAPGETVVSVTSANTVISIGKAEIARVAPGVFAANANGRGVVAAVAQRVKADGSQDYEMIFQYDAAQKRFVAIPVDLGPETDRVFLAIFGTGWRFRSSESAVKVTVGGADVPVIYAGSQPTFVGLDQINVQLPRTLAGKGEVDLMVTVDGKVANTTRISIK